VRPFERLRIGWSVEATYIGVKSAEKERCYQFDGFATDVGREGLA
jgi:hypothetical protein